MKYEDVSKTIHERLKSQSDRTVQRVLIPLALILGAILIYAGFVMTSPTVTPEAPKERSWNVGAATVQFQDIQPRQVLFGEVVAGRETELRALVAGRVVETGPTFREGGVAKAGDLLLQIDDFDYKAAVDNAKAQLREAQARLQSERDGLSIDQQQLDIAVRDFERAKTLHEKGTVAQAYLDNAERTYNQARWAVSSRKSAVEMQAAQVQQREVALRRAERDLSDTRLTAPFDGYVGDVSAELGKRVGVNDRIAVISDSDRIEVKFNVTDAQYGRILAAGEDIVGRPVDVTWQVGGAPLTYQGTVERVGARIEAQTGGVELYALLDIAPDAVPLRPGAFVEVRFPDRAYENVVELPEGAVFQGDRVYVIVDGRLQPRQVEVAGYAGDDVFLRGALQDGDRVLTTRFPEVGEGVLVTVRGE